MELDVCLKRVGEEAWGFRLIGGVDFNMPLTVVKVVPQSPADMSGLNNGDTVVAINRADATTMTHEDSKTALAAAADCLQLGVVRGLYDPVLDDYDPIYEPVDQEDFDQPSQPTEVPDDLDLTLTLPQFANTLPDDPNCIFKPLPDALNGRDPRSLTASPFVLPTKPYRPFSTEPIAEIPALEDPIILNPEFHDEFGRLKDIEEFLPKTRFKLPISEQYDPNGTKQKMKLEGVKNIDVTTKDSMTMITENICIKEETKKKKDFKVKEKIMKTEEILFLEEKKKEFDLKTIENTATSVVDSSIEKAVTVTEEIKKEIDIELSESSDSESSKIKSVKKSAVKESSTVISAHEEETSKVDRKETSIKEVKQLVNLIDETTEEIVKSKESNISHVDVIDSKSEQKISTSEKSTSQEVEKVSNVQKDIKESQDQQRKVSIQESRSDTVNIKEQRDLSQSNKYSTSKLLSEQRAYTLGLQTIPNIRGTAHSSYHYDLLLKTFFIHLTDVMVALSRFILAEPVLSKQDANKDISETSVEHEKVISKSQEIVTDKKIGEVVKTEAKKDTVSSTEKIHDDVTQAAILTTKAFRVVTPEKKERVVGKILQKAHEIKHQDKEQSFKLEEQRATHESHQTDVKHVDESVREQQIIKKRDLSGSRMAQLTEKKPEELMQHMENVLTEFESKSYNEDIEVVRERRSRSRSTVVTPVDNMQLDKCSQEVIEHSSLTTNEMAYSMSESGYESTDYEIVNGERTYIGIVQSHVYTNKNAIFEQLSLESTNVDVSKEVVEVTSSEKLDIKSSENNEKTIQDVVEVVSTETENQIQVSENIETKSKESAKVEDVQNIEVQAFQNDVKSVENIQKNGKKVQSITIQEITEPVVDQYESSFNQNYIVTEAKEDTTNTEFIRKHKQVTIVEETDSSKEESSCTNEISSVVVEKKTALKEDNIPPKVKVPFKQAFIPRRRQEILPVESVQKENKDEQEVKETSIKVEEKIIAVKDTEEENTFTIHNFTKKEAISNEKIASQQNSTVAKEKDEFIALKVSKEQFVENKNTFVEVEEKLDVSLEKVEISEFNSLSVSEHVESKYVEQETTFVAKSINQESTIIAETECKDKINEKSCSVTSSVKEIKDNLKLSLDTNYAHKNFESVLSDDGDLTKTPTPSTVPPTPLTDEYIFKLVAKLPKREGPPIPRDCTPSDDEGEDPHIVKKGLVPQIEASIEEQKIFNPPLCTPPTSPTSPKSLGLKGGAPILPRYFKPGLRGGAPTFPIHFKSQKSPVYVKPGLKGGSDKEYNQEEIKEIELKSSLLASAIDETIKSIEEYKEEVGIKKQVTESSTEIKESFQDSVLYNGYAKVVENKIFETALNDTKNTEYINMIPEFTNGIVDLNIKEEQAKVITNGFSDRIVETHPKIESQSEFHFNGLNIVPSDKKIETKEIITEENSYTPNGIDDKNLEHVKKHVLIVEERRDPMEGYRPVPFDPEELNAQRERRAALGIKIPYLTPSQERELYKTPSGDIIGTHQGIVDGLEEAMVDSDVAKELGKPGITEEKIAELISGEAEMLREAHVMGLSRVIRSHMHRDCDDSSVDFNKIKPIVESLKDSEVLKALNEELLRDAEERKKKEAKKEAWTTFLQKPKRPVPKSKFGYYKDMTMEEEKVELYKPKIVKQPKPKIAPDYKPKDFNTGLLPWEERALREPTPPPVEPEDPILIPEEAPEILEAVDPLPESEVPDLEDSGIPLPPSPEPKELTPPPEEEETKEDELDLEAVVEDTEKIVKQNLEEEMEGNNIAEQIMTSVQNMVDPNAPLEQQLAAMRAQLAALAQLPGVIQQSLEMVTRQLAMLGQTEASQHPAIEEMPEADTTPAAVEETEVSENGGPTIEEIPQEEEAQPEPVEPSAPTLTPEELERMRKEEELMLEEQRRMEKQKKELMEQARIEHESRQLKQRPTPRVGNPLPDPRVGNGKPQPVFGPLAPSERPVVLPGGRKWRTPKDAYNDAFIAETLQAQAELIAGKAMGLSYESVLLPYDQRVNFMKYEKPPVSLDHLKDSDTYKMIHNMEMSTPKRVDMLTPVIAEADYREKCRSMTPCPQQVQP